MGGGLLPTTLFVLQAGRVLTLLNSLYAAYFRKWLSECLPPPLLLYGRGIGMIK